MISIKDVAQKAGVSISTVSLAYNSPVRVSDATREKIYQAAKELVQNKLNFCYIFLR